MKNIIEVNNVSFEYITDENTLKAIDNLDLQVKEGEFVAIIGHNGSGKSTLSKNLNAILFPTEGNILINKLWDIRQTAGMVFQNPDNQIVATVVEEDVAFGPENLGIEPNEIRKRVEESLKSVGMYELRDRQPHLLSGGQKQRVGIARALANDPRILLCDEATSALDPDTTKSILELLLKINKKLNITIIMITHQMEVVQRICNHIAVMSEGKVIEEGTVKEIFTSPQHSVTKSFIQEGKNHNEFDETVLKKIYSKGRLLKVVFDENVSRLPILTKVIRECDSDINVIEANLSNTIDSSFGIMILQVIGDYEKVITLFEKYLAKVEVM